MVFPHLHYFACVACLWFLLYFRGADCILKENQVKKAKAGVLVYKDKQTSCALAPIDSKAAVVAANCLDKQIVKTTPDEYSVYFNGGIDDKTARYIVETITIHPEYNSTMLANNIAVLQYNSNSTDIEWQNTILVGGSTIFYFFYFVQFTLDNVESMTWAQYSYTTVERGDNATCKSMSPLFAKNELGLFCSSRIMDTTDLSKCPVPYGSLYNVYKGDGMLVTGIYSFSAISGSDSLCSYEQQRSYYTMVGLYVEYLKGVIRRNITLAYDEEFYEQGAKELSSNPNFSMNQTSTAANPQFAMITGDLYSNQTTDGAHSSNSASNESGDDNTTTEGTSASDSTDSIGNSRSSHMAGIIAGACIGAIGLVSICGAIYYIRRRQKKSPGVADPMRNNDFQNMLEASRPGQTTVGDYDIHTIADYDLPPVYEEAKEHRVVSQNLTSENRIPNH